MHTTTYNFKLRANRRKLQVSTAAAKLIPVLASIRQRHGINAIFWGSEMAHEVSNA